MGLFGWSLPPGCGTLPGEEEGSYVVEIDGIEYAWGEDDLVYKYDPAHPGAREDGFVMIGTLAWPDHDDGAAELKAFVRGL